MTKPTPVFDHLVVAAQTLDIGVAHVEAQLGVTIPRGGQHVKFATHNCVGRTGEGVYLEIIAIDPDATPQHTPRWFSLDEPATRARLDADGAYLHHWVIRTPDIDGTLAGLTVDPGPAVDMSRGELRWRIAVRGDGKLLHDGLFPTVIEWPPGVHPATNMTDLGITKESVTLATADANDLEAALTAAGVQDFVSLERGAAPRITATFARGDQRLTLS